MTAAELLSLAAAWRASEGEARVDAHMALRRAAEEMEAAARLQTERANQAEAELFAMRGGR
jgi:hypothetical protein